MTESACENIHERVRMLEYWKNGNGAKGAAKMIEEAEARIDQIYLHHATEPQIIREAVEEAMKRRSRSVEGLIRALGPYFAAIASILIATMTKGA